MPDSLVEQAAPGLTSTELVWFAIAEELAKTEVTGSWREYTFHPEHDLEHVRGTSPKTFRRYLDGFAYDLRRKGLRVGAGELDNLLGLYGWARQFGLEIGHMAFLGRKVLGELKAQEQDPRNAVAEKQQHGELLPEATSPRYGKPSFQLLVKPGADDTDELIALVISQDGKHYRNKYPKRLLHFVSKRLRAGVEEIA
jgi:hypothetical protein